jgi:uncharacterized membrane protein YqjE
MEPAQPLIGRVKSLLDQLLRIVQTRVDLISAEIQSEKLALTRQWQLAIFAVVFMSLAGVTFIVWLGLTLPPHLRTTVMGIVFFVFVGGAVGCGIAIHRRQKRPPLFARVAHQLRLDRAALTRGEEQ